MNLREARQEVEARKQALNELIQQKEGLDQESQGLQEKRTVAVRALAGGDGDQEKTIAELEAQISPLSLRLEGLEVLAAEAREALAAAKQGLREAEEWESAELAQFIQEKEAEEAERILQAVPAREQRIFELYIQLCQEVAEFHLDKMRIEELHLKGLAGPQHGLIEKSLVPLVANLTKKAKDEGWRDFMGPGYPGRLVVWAMIQPDPEFVLRPAGQLNFLEYAAQRRAKAVEGYIAQFKHGRE